MHAGGCCKPWCYPELPVLSIIVKSAESGCGMWAYLFREQRLGAERVCLSLKLEIIAGAVLLASCIGHRKSATGWAALFLFLVTALILRPKGGLGDSPLFCNPPRTKSALLDLVGAIRKDRAYEVSG